MSPGGPKVCRYRAELVARNWDEDAYLGKGLHLERGFWRRIGCTAAKCTHTPRGQGRPREEKMRVRASAQTVRLVKLGLGTANVYRSVLASMHAP